MATVYIATTGSDAYTYAQAQSSATPWLTPGKVNTSATTGDTVSMAAGTYTWASVTFTKVFTWNGAALVNGLPTTILDGAAAHVRTISSAATQTWNNIKFQNVIQTSDAGIFESVSANGGIFTLCVFTNLQIRGANIGDGYGLFSSSGAPTAVPWTLTNCLFYNIQAATATTTAPYIFDGRETTVIMTGCTFYNVATGANALGGLFRRNFVGTFSITIKNCIFYSNPAINYSFGTIVNTSISYSDFYQITSAPTGTGTITSDPLLIDPSNPTTPNFRLSQSSPCVGTAIVP